MALHRLCIAAGCDELALDGGNRCTDHDSKRRADTDQAKAAAKTSALAREGSELYRSRAWQQASKRFRMQHPLCAQCEADGIVTASAETDHIEPHRGDKHLFWKQANWQPLCKSCHSRKTAKEVFHPRIGEGGIKKPKTQTG